MIKRFIAIFLSGFLLTIGFSVRSDQLAVKLIVDVVGGKANTGSIILSLFSSENNFLKSPVRSQTKTVNQLGGASFELTDLVPGIYAISVVYDEDENGELNTGLMGIPKELVGFSNNAKGMFGPPKFEKAAIDVNSATQITIFLGKAG